MDLSRLNPPQRAAVEHGEGPLLILAGAGSGKTRVITHRIALLMAQGVPPEQILAVTFTNKAAGEMRERVQSLVRRSLSGLTVGTFHAFGLGVLKSERKHLGFPRGFAIYDAADQLGVVREVMRRLQTGDRRYDVKAILARISLAKNAFIAPEDYAPNESDEYDGIVAEVYPRYQQALRAFAAVDFDDLITETVRLMDRVQDVRQRWGSRFTYVMVDEFQDTNRAQIKLLNHLVPHRNLCVVGDDDQSIYAWRGADPQNILSFDQLFPDTKVVKLEQNYRSTPEILAAANAVIANNDARYDKQLWSKNDHGPRVVSVAADRPEDEAAYVCEEIGRLSRPYRDIAILYRSNVQTRLLEEELRERRLPYVMYGGQQFFERKEVKDLIAYLRVALSARDEISLRRVINYPARGIGATTIERVTQFAHDHGITLWTAFTRAEEIEELTTVARRNIDGFLRVMRRLQSDLADGVESATRALIERIELYDDLRSASPSSTAAQRRVDNVAYLLRSLARHEQAKPGREALLEHLRRLSLDANDDNGEGDSSDRMTLVTLHGAKGLEFPVVFLVGMEEELLPHARTLMPQATDLCDPDHAADVSEERRLAYVGITRAQEQLYLVRCRLRRRNGKEVPRTPSRFLLEIPEDLLEERDAASVARQAPATDEVKAFFANFSFD